MAWLLKNLSLRRCKGIRQLVVILVLRGRRSEGAAESGHTLCASSTNRSLSASPQKIPVDRYACFHRRMTSGRLVGLPCLVHSLRINLSHDHHHPQLPCPGFFRLLTVRDVPAYSVARVGCGSLRNGAAGEQADAA